MFIFLPLFDNLQHAFYHIFIILVKISKNNDKNSQKSPLSDVLLEYFFVASLIVE